ncbi:ATP-binding cassette domain-containing protein [Candidatus Peregrinibacteria bacterium]|nr:ATP-binding cassette domain-containing protein [Candidatus Peregrinibacteria bacterium]
MSKSNTQKPKEPDSRLRRPIKNPKASSSKTGQNVNKQNRKIAVSRLLKYYWSQMKGHRLIFLLVSLMIASASALSIYGTTLLGDFIELMTSNQPSKIVTEKAWNVLFILVATIFVVFALWRIAGFITGYFEAKVMKKISKNSYQYLIQHSYDFFTNNFAGSLVKKMGRLFNSYEVIVDLFLFDVIKSTVTLLSVTIVIFYYNIWLGAIVLLMTMASLILHHKIGKYKYVKYDLPFAEMDSKLGASIADAISNVSTIKTFGAEHYEFKKYGKLIEKWRKQAFKTWTFGQILDASLDFVLQSFRVIMLVVSLIMWINGQIEASEFVVIQVFMFQVWDILFFLGRIFRRYYKHTADADEMMEILDSPHQIKDLENATELRIRSGLVEFQNVGFKYGPGQKPVLKNINLRIKSGEKVALVGPSGGGKSTILKVLMRFYDINKGKILIDGQDISNVSQSSLHQSIAMVPQEPILFHRTLLENIRYGRFEASEEEVIAASKMAYCHEFIMSFEKGYQTYVGERGVKLSGGQRQRVAIARAILSNAKILILDEATSSLDSESEKYIQKALENLIRNKTVIVIAHRLSTIMSSDNIIVLKDGEIVEKGAHGDLRNKKGSLYGRLWDTQVGEFITPKIK